MPVSHTNRRGKTYYLHQGKTKTGKPKYFFSMNQDGDLLETIPDGYEIYELPTSAQVFLCKIQPKLIWDSEKGLVKKGLAALSDKKSYLLYIEGNAITIYEAETLQHLEEPPFSFFRKRQPQYSSTYTAVLRFVLADDEQRTFIAQRYSFLGSMESWFYLAGAAPLEGHVTKYVPRLDEDSLIDFY
jgi:hypothetical protein